MKKLLFLLVLVANTAFAQDLMEAQFEFAIAKKELFSLPLSSTEKAGLVVGILELMEEGLSGDFWLEVRYRYTTSKINCYLDHRDEFLRKIKTPSDSKKFLLECII